MDDTQDIVRALQRVHGNSVESLVDKLVEIAEHEHRELVRLQRLGLLYILMALVMVTVYGASYIANGRPPDGITALMWGIACVFALRIRHAPDHGTIDHG